MGRDLAEFNDGEVKVASTIISRRGDWNNFNKGDTFIPISEDGNLEFLQKNRGIPNNMQNVLDLRSDVKKFIVPIHESYYHFIHDQVGQTLRIIKDFPDVEIYFGLSRKLIPGQPIFPEPEFIRFLPEALRDIGIKAKIIFLGSYSGIIANNLYIITNEENSRSNPEDIFDFYKRYVSDKGKPHKKVYLSRSHIPNRSFVDDFGQASNDNRVGDHEKIESFFKNLGFEIIIPERDFKTFRDQINYFYGVKTLVSATSSGLSNAMFMQPNQTVIEITTPLNIHMFDYENMNGGPMISPFMGKMFTQDEIHHFYSNISFHKNHLHVSIPNKDKDSSKVINFISKSKILMDLLSDDSAPVASSSKKWFKR